MSWLGLDVGTSSVKALLVADDGRVRGRGAAAYGSLPATGPATDEQDPRRWLDAVREAVAAAGAARAELRGVAVVGQTPTLVVVDARLRPLRPALTWRDGRARAEADELAERLGEPEPLLGTALPWSASNPPAKLLWLARHEPELVRSAHLVLQAKDFVAAALTGEAATDRWSAKGLVDVRSGEPAEAVLAACGWERCHVPPVAAPEQPLAAVSEAGAARSGLPAGVPVAVGWTDACAGMLGLGAFAEPRAFVLTGTSDVVGASGLDRAADGLLRIPAACAPLPVVYGPTQSSGAALAWAREVLQVGHAELIELARGAHGTPPLVLPYLDGERAPLWRPRLRGGLLGLGREHGRAELALGVLEGVALTARHVLSAAGADDAPVHLAPGTLGALEVELRLRTLARPVVVHEERNQSALGAAMLARAAVEGDLAAAQRALGGATTLRAPDDGEAAAGADRWRRFRDGVEVAVAWSEAER